MDILNEELKELRKCVEKQIPFSKLEACVKAMVRVNIQVTKYKQVVVCCQFPEDYPKKLVLIEIRSRHISQKLTDGLTKLCESEIKKYIGKPQVLNILKFVAEFIQENPLCCCSEEISCVKKLLHSSDELKLKQKSSAVILRLCDNDFVLKYHLTIPENYPDTQVKIEEKFCNFPPVLKRWFFAQSEEIARRCVMRPSKVRPKDPPFVLKPSLYPVISFLVKEVHLCPKMKCPVCEETCFPHDPGAVEMDEYGPNFVDRIYCGHIYHFKCLDSFIRTPPFQGNKKCVACGLCIYHDKWKLTPQVAEARWAHKQAKQRELDEVVEFLS